MFNYRCLFLVALCSFPALGAVDLNEKQVRIEYLEELSKTATSMNIEAFRRELKYEESGLTLKKRAENEAQLLAEKIKLQVISAYEKALEETGNSQEAAEEIRREIEKDIVLIDISLQEDLRELALRTLDNVQRGEITPTDDLQNLQSNMLPAVKSRSEYLNQELGLHKSTISNEKVNYKDQKEILDSLVSDGENARRPLTSHTNLKSTNVTKVDAKISLQVKVNFLGIAVEAGPTISFNRQYITNFDLLSDGLHPALSPEGRFDFSKRDKSGNVVYKNGKPQKRFISFACEAALNFSTDYSGSGGFSVMGVGGAVNVAKIYSNTVNLISRRVAVPEVIDGKLMNYKLLSDLCHDSFLKARITNNLSVANSLNVMMKNVVSGLSFSHPKTQCAVDSHCNKWFNSLSSYVKRNSVPRCVENAKEKYMACELRGRQGQLCPVYNKYGRRVSGGGFELKCDKGLRCKTVSAESFFFTAIGKCSR